MKRLIISAILIFALTNHAYGLERFGGNSQIDNGGAAKETGSSGGNNNTIIMAGNIGGIGAAAQVYDTIDASIPVLEATILILIGASLFTLFGFGKKSER